ncbi:hypothetical protein F5X99DRAFT_185089 [Biscogniauxia marginata]|nr:hypothetical protein F5X99DRAFT_185089 [Biscogniauxia marginata]
MFLHRMALKPLLRQLLIWTLVSTAFTHAIQLGTDISTRVPQCAWRCLEIFIQDNFPSTNCGTYSSLPCLCSSRSALGFTLGEGAVQCMIGEKQVNACVGNDTSNYAISAALNMCSGQPSASPNTHGTLTASFIVPSSGGVVSLIVPTQTSMPPPVLSSSMMVSTTTLRTSSSATPTISTTSRTTSRPTSSSTTSTVATSTTAASATATNSQPAQTSEAAASPTTLAPGQVAGIAIGISGAIAIALGAICCARRVRKRKYPEIEKDFYHMDDDRSSSVPPVSRLSQVFHISPPLLRTSKYQPEIRSPIQPPAQFPLHSPDRTPVQPPRPVNRAPNVDRDTIGLAISRPRSLAFGNVSSTPPQTPIQRKPSKLLPAKPNLTLRIPPQSATTGAPSSQAPPTTGRESTMTNMTAFADLDTEAVEGGQIWRPPPTDPQSATTLYVADKWGNWVLSNSNRQSQLAQVAEAAELDTYTPLTKSPIEKREEEAAARMAAAISATSAFPKRPQPAFLDKDPIDQTVSRSSSLYSQASAVRQNTRGSRSSRGNSLSKSRKGSEVQLDRSDSKASVTTINTSSTTFDDESVFESDIARLSHLSPVMEAPSPTPGRSQVTYPKIPGRLDRATIRFVPPPKRPNFMNSPPGQPSPTLGAVHPVRSSPSDYPAPLNPRRSGVPRYPAQTSGSGFSPERENPNIVVYPYRNSRNFDRVQPPVQSPPRSNFSPTVPNVEAGPPNPNNWRSNNTRAQTPVQRRRSGFSSSPQTEESFPPGPLTPPPLSPRRQQPPWLDTGMQEQGRARTVSPMSSTTISSATSSLLAKRVGPDRAAALALDANGGRKPEQWKRQDHGSLLSPDAAALASPRGKGTLPMTPTWQPKLTPTRRGDDLFLNVQ